MGKEGRGREVVARGRKEGIFHGSGSHEANPLFAHEGVIILN